MKKYNQMFKKWLKNFNFDNILEHFPVGVKVLQAWVLFGGKIYYKKNEGFRTPHISGLNALIHGLEVCNLTYGAGYGIRTHDPLDHNQML